MGENQHCGGVGQLIEGSPNVVVGDSGGSGGSSGAGSGASGGASSASSSQVAVRSGSGVGGGASSARSSQVAGRSGRPEDGARVGKRCWKVVQNVSHTRYGIYCEGIGMIYAETADPAGVTRGKLIRVSP